MKTLKWIGKALGNRKWFIILISLLEALLALSSVLLALVMRQVIDQAVGGHRDAFLQALLLMGALLLGQILLRWLERFLEDDTRAVIENRLRQKAFREILQTEYAKTKEYHTGELMNRITSDTQVVTEGAVSILPSFSSIGVRILGVLVVMAAIEPGIAIVFLVGGCIMAALSVLPRKLQKRMHKDVQEADGAVRSFVQESLESILVIRAFGCEEKIEDASADKMAEHRRARKRKSHIVNFFTSGLRLCIQCGYIFGFAWCGFGIIEQRITYGTMTAVIQLIGQIQMPFANIGSAFPKYTSMLASAERLMEFSEQAREVKNEETKWTREVAYQNMESIDFEQVSFAYDADRPVLNRESFSVKKGEFAALIGSSGIGKSTVMKLLLSVYQPNEGEIAVNMGEERASLSDLPAGMFAYVPQGNYLMGGSIWQVVGFAEKEEQINKEKVIKACKIACADEFVSQLSNGYDTVLGERGSGLSEGQMQRLAVARAIYSGCPILLLDEATSALDSDTERRLIISLKQMSNCTVFLVTHRKEVWELCDRVLERTE